jgi:hypothetical protein
LYYKAIKHLSWHDFPVDPTDVDAGVEAGLVVRVDDVPAVDSVCSDGAVVRSLPHNFRILGSFTSTKCELNLFIYLRAWVSTQWPPKRPVVVLLEEGVLLFNPKPDFCTQLGRKLKQIRYQSAEAH